MTAAGQRALWLDPRFGAAGDMILGALLGLGAAVDDVAARLDGLGVEGWSLRFEPATRGSLTAGRAVVTAEAGPHHRPWSAIDALLAAAGLPDRVASGARATFRRLGEVEAGVHGVALDDVHFHEVGAVDAIVDIVGSWLALDLLGAETVVVGAVGIGTGTVRATHGTLPVPAPATAELLCGADVRPVDDEAETVTPTGAALLATMATAWGPMPPGRLLAVARGAGRRDPAAHPNVLTAYLIESVPGGAVPAGDPVSAGDPVPIGAVPAGEPVARRTTAAVLSTNLDDVTGEIVAHTIDRCLAMGADDAWAGATVMKKGRPGVELHVLCRPDLVEDVQRIVFAETGTLGIRTRLVAKDALPRRFETVTVRGETVRIKVGPFGAKPEHADLVAAAERLGLPVRQLAGEALAALPSGAHPAPK